MYKWFTTGASLYLNHKLVFSDWGRLVVAVETHPMLSAADPPSTVDPLWTDKRTLNARNTYFVLFHHWLCTINFERHI